MAQHDYVIANGTGAAVRSDLNNGLSAIVTQNSGATEPATTYAFMRWADTTAGVMKMRNSANNAWITLYQLDGEWTNIAFENGTAAAPSIYFKDSGTDTGFYSPGANQVGISTGGTARLTIDSNGNVDIDSNTLYVDATNNRVGLGTSSPGALLTVGAGSASVYTDVQINGATTANYGPKFALLHGGTEIFEIANYGRVQGGTSSDVLVETVGSNKLQLGTNRIVALTVDTSQRVGIGTTSVSNKFVVSNGGAEGYEISPGFASNDNLLLSINRSGSVYCGNTQNASFHRWLIQDSEKARLDSSGRFLVGTSSSVGFGCSLQVVNSNGINAEIIRNSADGGGPTHALGKSRGSASSPSIVLSGDVIGTINFRGYDGSNYIETAFIQAAVDGTPGTNDMPGRLVFSTTADGASSPTERMRIANDGLHSSYSNAVVTVWSSNYSASASNTIFIGRYGATAVNGGSDCIYIRSNGNIQNTNNSYGAISDIKLKENIVDASSQWDDLKALQVRNYNFKEGQTHTQIGLIAQEVELVSPGLVSESPDRDAEGNDLGTVTKSVNYSVLYMKAVKALQEAMERIETLEAKVAALEGV